MDSKEVFCEFTANVEGRVKRVLMMNYNVLCVSDKNVLYVAAAFWADELDI